MIAIPPGLKEALQAARRVLVACHVNPDGDAIGSTAGIAAIALHCGAEARILLPAPLPEFLSWLPLPAPVVSGLAQMGDWKPDLICLVDCGDFARAGQELADLMQAYAGQDGEGRAGVMTMNIDHHVSNPAYADINWVEPGCSATGELVGLLAEAEGMKLEGVLGQALYLALSSDTGNFTYSNTTASCLAMASRIVANGLNVARFTDLYENNWDVERMHLWGRLMSEIALHEAGAIAVSVVPSHYLTERGLRRSALEGFASWIRRLRGVRVSLFVREDSPGFCKISLRSMGDVNVQTIASRFGGGGHAAAAGAEISLPPEAIVRELLPLLREAL